MRKEINIIDTIYSINRDYYINTDNSPCVKLPNETWEGRSLETECPDCGGKLKFNPFVVDNKGMWN
jgi:hypothetical protein